MKIYIFILIPLICTLSPKCVNLFGASAILFDDNLLPPSSSSLLDELNNSENKHTNSEQYNNDQNEKDSVIFGNNNNDNNQNFESKPPDVYHQYNSDEQHQQHHHYHHHHLDDHQQSSTFNEFMDFSTEENYFENVVHQPKHKQQKREYQQNLDSETFYNENYAIEDVHSDEDNIAENPLNDYPYNNNRKRDNIQPSSYSGRRFFPEKLLYTPEITIKQGKIRGIIRNLQNIKLGEVYQYLGLPYAEAPIGNRRFMPPGAPPPWQGVKLAAHLPPVCPQNIPDLNKSNIRLSKGRLDQLSRLLPYLKNESEDCLFLNVYVPKADGKQNPKYPVIVYIHGESYEWNSGNPYDGSILANYGQVIVVTLNYRLGVFGFMKPSVNENTVSNFGLLDQIAALQWVKDNIAFFNGDDNSVTVMGHGTGAACANFLMVSPVAEGLFNRTILMSGSAMSDWAISNHSFQISMQIAHGVNCPLTDANDEMLTCLRKKRYQDLLKIPTSSPQFSTSLGPIVDELVIPNQPYKLMGINPELFSRYDLLFGVTEVESYHILNAQALDEGLRENDRDNLLRRYMQSRVEIRPDLALAATLKRYTDIYNNPVRATTHEHRDLVLDVLSDARVVGPLIQTGVFHAKVNPRSYMYVFGHNSGAGAYANLPHSITGEELAFIFGAPLAPAGPFHNNYSPQEKLLSEAVMLYWSNFAKTGNPKAPWRYSFLNRDKLEWVRYDIDWPEFNARNQCYVNIGIPPSIGYRYRNVYMNFWNKELPDELNQIAAVQPPPFIHFFPPNPTQVPRRGTSTDPNEIITGHLSKYPLKRDEDTTTKNPLRTIKFLLQENTLPETADNMYNAQPTFGSGIFREAGGGGSGRAAVGVPGAPTIETSKALSPDGGTILTNDTEHNEREEIVEQSASAVPILIGVVVLFIVFNFIIAVAYIVKKKTKHSPFSRKLTILSYDGATDDELKRSKHTGDGDDSYILDLVRKSNTYEPVKTNTSPINGFKVARQLSTSTVDPHTKVSDWITQDMLEKSSPKSSKKSSPSFSIRRSFLKKPRKVSIGIDATPQARSGSVLRQEPIEVTKFKTGIDNSKNIIICQEIDVEPELLSHESIDTNSLLFIRRGSTSSIPAAVAEYQTELKIAHKHSRSDPVDMYCSVHTNNEKITSFIDDSIDGDINVTSRDDSVEKDPLTPEEQIRTIKKLNFPKVLPDYPQLSNDDLPSPVKRLSSFNFPINLVNRKQEGGIEESGVFGLGSGAQNYIIPPPCRNNGNGNRIPPVPPPRTMSSTFGGRLSCRRESNNITTSPLMLAEDCSDDGKDEPEIAQNTLIVGPLIPKNQESIYCTVNRNKSYQQMNNNSSEQTQSIQHNDVETKSKKPSGIKPPSSSTFIATAQQHHQQTNKQQQQPHQQSSIPIDVPRVEPKVIIRPSPPKSLSKFQTPRINGNSSGVSSGASGGASSGSGISGIPGNTGGYNADPICLSRIPQLKPSSVYSLTVERDKSTPESSSSDTTCSSTGTVKTELKQN